MINKHLRFLLLPVFIFTATLIFTSCDTSKKTIADYEYFRNGSDTVFVSRKATIIQNGDQLSIQVLSGTTNQEQTAIFNLPSTSTTQAGETQVQGQGLIYQVNQSGDIQMPVIGTVKAAGLTLSELNTLLADKLADYVKNPRLLIRYLQFNVDVLGEVKLPGTQRFQTDRVTVLDAIGAAGDLTDYGRRDDVKVVREENNKKVYYTVDLRSKSIFKSPVYVLHPGDIIYVSPNNVKIKTLNVDPEAERRVTTIVTLLSIVISLGTLIVIAKK